jgi:hypothetical protein
MTKISNRQIANGLMRTAQTLVQITPHYKDIRDECAFAWCVHVIIEAAAQLAPPKVEPPPAGDAANAPTQEQIAEDTARVKALARSEAAKKAAKTRAANKAKSADTAKDGETHAADDASDASSGVTS